MYFGDVDHLQQWDYSLMATIPIYMWCEFCTFSIDCLLDETIDCCRLEENWTILNQFWTNWTIFWHGLWTWPPWVVYGPAFHHKLKKFCTFRVSETVLFKKAHKWTDELRTGQRKGHSMDYCGTTLQLVSQFKMADRRIKLQETQLYILWCGTALFWQHCFSLAEISMLKIS